MPFCSRIKFFERNVNFENSNFGIDLDGSNAEMATYTGEANFSNF